MNKKLFHAFTLIELLVVIAIIGILSGLIIVGMSGATRKATVAKAQVFSNSLRNSLMMNLVSEWKLDGSANDTWGGQNGSLVGPPVLQTTANCVSGTCYSFNGSTQYISIPHPVGTDVFDFGSQMTAFVWVKGVAQNNTHIIAQFDGGASQRAWRIAVYGPNPYNRLYVDIAADVQTDRKTYYTDAIAFDDNWHLVGFTFGSGTLKLYVDGLESGVTKTSDSAITLIHNSTANAYIGCNSNNGSPAAFFAGSIDEARLYSAAIPTSQIQQIYCAGLNKLFVQKNIGAFEYQRRMAELKSNYAKK
ncbi:MAG: LamG domain-containing protein [Candidatus Pacebacteria bacterium]|nr:LamG domain-containing protein [Candidatus Paceibacterota bacterium]